jgi:hypothetical protein
MLKFIVCRLIPDAACSSETNAGHPIFFQDTGHGKQRYPGIRLARGEGTG